MIEKQEVTMSEIKAHDGNIDLTLRLGCTSTTNLEPIKEPENDTEMFTDGDIDLTLRLGSNTEKTEKSSHSKEPKGKQNKRVYGDIDLKLRLGRSRGVMKPTYNKKLLSSHCQLQIKEEIKDLEVRPLVIKWIGGDT